MATVSAATGTLFKSQFPGVLQLPPAGLVHLREAGTSGGTNTVTIEVSANPPEEENEVSLFGIDGSREETQFWNPKFYALCFQDLKELSYPSFKSVAQTVVTSQIAFVVIFISIILFDGLAEASVRSLVQGKPFLPTFDGSASPTRGV